jgi:hypothetical protein
MSIRMSSSVSVFSFMLLWDTLCTNLYDERFLLPRIGHFAIIFD